MGVKKILVLDDDPNIRKLFVNLFKVAGFDVVACEEVEEARKVLAKENISIMFFDLRLPGISGIEFCKEVRKRNPIPVIYAMTGYTSLFELAECRAAGFDDYFTKPMEMKSLIDAAESAAEKINRWKSKN